MNPQLPEITTLSAGLELQRALFASGATRSLGFRGQALRRLAAGIEGREAELLAALRADLGKCETEAFTAELGYVLGDLRHTLKRLAGWARPRPVGGKPLLFPGSARVVPEPLGVSLVIGPWNYPFQLLFAPALAAIAAGNCVTLKPSEHAPRTAQVVEALVAECFEPGHVRVVTGGPEVGRALVGAGFDHVFFTGGSAAGRAIMAGAAASLTPVTLELGGKSPCLVWRDADLPVAAERIAWGKFLNAGQTCVAPDYLLVHREVQARLVELLEQAMARFYGDDPQRSPDYARIVNAHHVERLRGLMAGGRIVRGGQVDPADRYVAPTLLTDVDPGSPLMQEEIFGPLLPIVSVSSLDEAQAWIMDRGRPLALYVFAGDAGLAEQFVGRIRCGGACVNDVMAQLFVRELSFGGVGESGFGRYHGQAGFDTFSNLKAVMVRSGFPESRKRYPPYTTPLATLRRLMRWAF